MAPRSFRATAGLLQQRWAKSKGYPSGPSPTRLAMPAAEAQLSNFLTPAIGALVRCEYERNTHVRDEASKKLFGHPRLFDNLLSSQPMCFNLFGELALDINLATTVFRRLFPDDVDQVQEIRFEYSPGRRNPRYLGNRTAADAIVIHTTPTGGRGFIAIETKYVEDLSGPSQWDEGRYGAKANQADGWTAGPPTTGRLSQITLDHLLALSMLLANDGWERGRFAFVYPEPNAACATAAKDYIDTLNAKGRATFTAVTIEQVHDAISRSTRKPWVDEFHRRYLDWDPPT